jgi:hypothetical protein
VRSSWHISPAVPREILGRYLQAGSLLDVTGDRVWDLSDDTVAAAHARWSRAGFAAEVQALWKKESVRLPHGPANHARCPGGLLLALRLNRCSNMVPPNGELLGPLAKRPSGACPVPVPPKPLSV